MRLLTLAASAAALLLTGQAHAATWFVKYASTSGERTNAFLTVTSSNKLNAVGGYDVTGIMGSVGAETVKGLIGNPNKRSYSYSTDGLFTYDNVIFAGAPTVSWYGLLFNDKSGNEYNLFSDNTSTYELYQAQGGSYMANSVGLVRAVKLAGSDIALPEAVPEPAAWTMMILGFGGIGAMMRRRQVALATA